MPINSKKKGARGERMLRDIFRAQGYTARRGQQFSGNPDAPDVIVPELASVFHFEGKVGNCNMTDAVIQAEADSGGKHWIVCHKPDRHPWRFVMSERTFFALVRGEIAITTQLADSQKQEAT